MPLFVGYSLVKFHLGCVGWALSVLRLNKPGSSSLMKDEISRERPELISFMSLYSTLTIKI